MAALTVVRPGMLTTIQDLGRWGFQSEGVPVAGPMDAWSHRHANRLVGNPDGAAAIEVTLIGPEFEADADVVCAVSGARFAIAVNGSPVSMYTTFVVPAGGRLRFGSRLAGARATLAVRSGIDIAPVFGSLATSLISRMGPFGGRPLAAGDVLPIARPGLGSDLDFLAAEKSRSDPAGPRLPDGGATLRVIMGPHDGMFTETARRTFLTERFVITPDSNRMGYRLEGPPLAHAGGADILSDATPIGSLQVPASGHPILLMADRQTTGGYPKIATVSTADLPLAGQLAPGDWIEFTEVTRAAALDALKQQEARLAGWRP